MRLARLLAYTRTVAIIFAASVGSGRLYAQAQAEPAAPAAAAQAAPINADLKRIADDFFHYASIGRYDLAKAEGEKIIGMNADPTEVHRAFEASIEDRNRRVLPDRRIELYERILSWQRQPDLAVVGAKLISIFNDANKKRRSDTGHIEEQVQRLGGGPRAYALAVEQLRSSGELAVPVMLSYLRDPARRELQVPIRNALKDLGIKALNPLLAATEMKDPVVLPWVVSALGDLGYDNAVPYLVRLLKTSDTPEAIKGATRQSLVRLHVQNGEQLNPAQLFFELAEKFYYEKASVAPDKGSNEAYIWTFSDQGLMNKTVPAATFNEDMTLRECEHALMLDASRGDAVSLWIAAGYKREAEIPEGQTDLFWDDKHPPTHYYAVASGTHHLNPALARALRDRNSAVALKAIKSLQEIVGTTNLFAGDDPLLDGLRYGDRQVRFEAAFAIAQALPQKSFAGQERVVPILAEALAQTGRPGVIVLAETDKLNAMREQLKAYNVQGGATADAAVAGASALSSVDVVIVFEGTSPIDRMMTLSRENLKLQRAGMLIVAQASKVATPYAQLALQNPSITITDAPSIADEAGLNAAIEEARKRAGGLSMDEKMATLYALRAAELLQRLAISRGQVFDLLVAQPAVLAALDDQRPEIARAAANALGLLNSREAQAALATKAMDEKTADEFKVILLKNLSVHGKFYGNQLDQSLIDGLSRLAESAANQDVKSAAAEALGALNLRSDQIKALIVNQAK